ncbi:MAG: response regulator transcription factor [Phototrophicales bacterium]
MRVLIIATDLLTRAGLAALLNPHVEVIGQIPITQTLTDDLSIYRPDVVIYDAGYEPQLDGLASLADLPLVVLLPNAESVLDVMTTLNDGIYAILHREATAAWIIQALDTVNEGLMVFDPALMEPLITRTEPFVEPLLEHLTPRESEVLQYLAQGLANKTIAQILGISPNTVKFHINAIFSKLNVQSRTEAVVRATQLGLIIL